jgi:hypothetical protein
MRCLLTFAAAAGLIIASGACGSIITIPDQGVVVLGCAPPGACYVLDDCSCKRADAQPGGACTVPAILPGGGGQCPSSGGSGTCLCPATVHGIVPSDLGGVTDLAGVTDMAGTPGPVAVQCLETAQACQGRGMFCGGTGARCLAAGTACSTSGGDPPQLVPSTGVGPALEPHCQFVDDVCCPGVDGGVSD